MDNAVPLQPMNFAYQPLQQNQLQFASPAFSPQFQYVPVNQIYHDNENVQQQQQQQQQPMMMSPQFIAVVPQNLPTQINQQNPSIQAPSIQTEHKPTSATSALVLGVLSWLKNLFFAKFKKIFKKLYKN